MEDEVGDRDKEANKESVDDDDDLDDKEVEGRSL